MTRPGTRKTDRIKPAPMPVSPVKIEGRTELASWMGVGRVVDDQRGEPISGVTLSARASFGGEQGGRRPTANSSGWLIAEGRTRVDGSFSLTLLPDAEPELRALVACAAPALSLRWGYEGTRGEAADVPLPLTGPLEIRIPVELSAEPTNWARIAEQTHSGPMTVASLTSAIRSGSFGLNPAEARRAVADLEIAVLDPTGRLSAVSPLPAWSSLRSDGGAAYETSLGRKADTVRVGKALGELGRRLLSYDDIDQVDWSIDRDRLVKGAIGDAIAVGAVIRDRDGSFVSLLPEQRGADDPIGYRDYLVGVWQKIAGLDPDFAFETPLDGGQAFDQLTARFHQDFGTTDIAPADATELALGIVTRILTEPAPTGLGIPAASIPPRGADTAVDYLLKLIAQSGEDADELGRRFRIRLDRTPRQLSTPVDENIATLQGLFRDSFQSDADPFRTAPDIRGNTFIPNWQSGRAPFFLEYEEWLAETAPFFPENVFSIERTLGLVELAKAAREIPTQDADHSWAQAAAPVLDQIGKGLAWLAKGEYGLALSELDGARTASLPLISQRQSTGFQVDEPLKARRQLKVSTKPDLLRLERYLGLYDGNNNSAPYQPPGPRIPGAIAAALVLFAGYFYWVLRSDALLALGRYVESAKSLEALARVVIGAGEQDSPSGYFDAMGWDEADLYTAGPLPYTFNRSDRTGFVVPWYQDIKYESVGGPVAYQFPPSRIRDFLHRIDRRLVELRLANVMLDWADALYRADDPSAISRARELYKGVLWLHGDDPEVSPSWPGTFQFLPGLPWSPANSAVQSQLDRARLGFFKIEAGLNYFGATDRAVPVQRYRALKDTADRFAALAKAAEHDFLTALGNLEALSIDELKTSNLFAKAKSQRAIAVEQGKIAEANVKVAQQQVADVQAQIAAKQAEIADRDAFFGQLSDFAAGMVGTFKSLPGDTQSALGSAFASEAGIDATESAGLLGLGAGATVLAGFGIFYYAGTTTLSAMATAQNGRKAQEQRLRDVALPLAQEAVVSRQREVKIADLQASVASADIDLATSLIAFQSARTLSSDFWASVAAILRRVLRRYLDLGAWAGWLAERALAFEQARQVRIIRMDYLAPQLQGVTGGDLLQSDLAELEASRVAGERVLVPFVMGFSLAEEQPLAFGALKARGMCRFTTSEEAARLQFPGTFGHRIRDLHVDVRIAPVGRRIRGILVNHGLSLASRDESLVLQPLLRFPDALPISETGGDPTSDPRLAEILGPFEGTGLDTEWTLELDRDSSPSWFGDITDLVIVVEGRARFSEAVRDAVTRPKHIDRFALLAASKYDPATLLMLNTTGTGTFSIDLATFPFSASEKNRRVTNVMVLLPGAPTGGTINGKLQLASPAKTIAFPIGDGVALSNGEPLRLQGSLTPDLPLNAVIGAKVEQVWKVTVGPLAAGARILDVILGVEYGADRV